MGPTRFIYVKSMAFDSTSRFLPGSRLVIEYVLFIADKMGDLSLHQPESWEIDGSNTDHFPSTPTQAGLACEARLGHGSSGPGEFESDPSGDSVNHHEMSLTLRVVEKSSLWGRVTPPPPTDETEAEIAQAVKAKITRVARLACEADKASGKRHHGQHQDSGALEIEADDGTAFGWTTPSSTGIVRSTEMDFETTLRLSMRNSNGSSGKVSKSTTSAQCFGLSGHN
jgi:hypothetical protein